MTQVSLAASSSLLSFAHSSCILEVKSSSFPTFKSLRSQLNTKCPFLFPPKEETDS